MVELPSKARTVYAQSSQNLGASSDTVEVPMITQERAYTPPIWYSPGR
ncbi:uncharacterized protein METZ01_LOCUS14908 [marine metagenome]|uniref:Uncharacterized protein n=1 Tax=marine metagenome TaxID=408172 RepID=A0A381P641_9ZZZZ